MLVLAFLWFFFHWVTVTPSSDAPMLAAHLPYQTKCTLQVQHRRSGIAKVLKAACNNRAHLNDDEMNQGKKMPDWVALKSRHSSWIPYATYEVTGSFAAKERYRNPGVFTLNPPYSPWVNFKAEEIKVIDAPLSWFNGIKQNLIALTCRDLPVHTCELFSALLFGSNLKPESQLIFKDSGLLHMIAISGFHVMVLIGTWECVFFFLLCRWAPLMYPNIRRFNLHVPVMWSSAALALLYGLIVLDSPPLWRSALMFALRPLPHLVQRRANPYALLGASMLIVSIADPWVMHDPSFLLSSLATFALILWRDFNLFSQAAPSWLKALFLAIKQTFAASLATFPLMFTWNHQWQWIAFISNVVALPLGVLMVPLAALQASMSGFHPVLGELFANISIPLSDLFVWVATLCADLQHSGWMQHASALPFYGKWDWMLLSLLASFVLFIPWINRCEMLHKVGAFCAVTLLLLLWFFSPHVSANFHPNSHANIHAIDVGQGDCFLLQSKDSHGQVHNMLIDTGGGFGTQDPGNKSLVPALFAYGVKTIDLLVITHAHPDHYGGLPTALNHFNVKRILTPAIAIESPKHWCVPQALGGVNMQVLWPCSPNDDALYFDNVNNSSLVMHITHGNNSMLFTGDIEEDVETLLLHEPLFLDALQPPIQLLKVPHHGSKTSSTKEFIHFLQPQISLISLGRGNRFMHPHPRTLDHLSSSQVLRTDESGGIWLVSDGKSLKRKE